MMKVYFAPFARSLRILWTLEELNAPYEPVRVQFPPRLAQPDYLHINPLGQVPTLIDGETKLFESVGACEYVNETNGGDLAGDRFTLADISVAYALNLGGMLRVAAEYTPNVAAYFERMKARPAFQAAAAHA